MLYTPNLNTKTGGIIYQSCGDGEGNPFGSNNRCYDCFPSWFYLSLVRNRNTGHDGCKMIGVRAICRWDVISFSIRGEIVRGEETRSCWGVINGSQYLKGLGRYQERSYLQKFWHWWVCYLFCPFWVLGSNRSIATHNIIPIINKKFYLN